ncbi:hypothetical protein C8A00DRAFT_40550 [Chaetomidium leptoderma]|uniref:Uncharacterized protein n=1 Tax=Chaetomidium leptoderma TaxID=669021 RepID=A0AAN6VSM4_9PEZI|nr:hypothetical protein C8A00DRAFT_40550 [Chaetomidium leptoderma]
MATSSMGAGTNPGMAYQPLNSSVFRLLTAALAFAGIIIWIVLGLISIQFSPIVLVFVEMFLVVGWNIAHVLPRRRFTQGFPTVLCQVGDCACVFNDDDGLPKKPVTKAQKRMKIVGTAMVDLALGLTIVVIMGDALELVIALITLAGCFCGLIIDCGLVVRHIDDPDTRTRIQLAPDTEDRRTAGGTVSVAA